MTSLEGDLRDVDGAALCRGLQAEFGKLYATGGGEQAEAVLAAGHHVAQEFFPLQLEAVIKFSVGRNFLPLAAEGFGDGQVRVPDRLGSVGALLRNALVQTGDGGTVRAVDLELNQFVAVHADGPEELIWPMTSSPPGVSSSKMP